ncbi:MAG: TolC family protein [Terracidiphilus sp.]|jgi:outer membrane protein TolC
MKIAHNPRRAWAPILLGLALTAAPALAPAQVSLATVVDLAQRNSIAVKLAETDVQKARAALAQTRYVYIPNLVVGSTVGTSIGFPTGQPSVANASMQSLVLSFPQRQYILAAEAGLKAASLNLKDAREQVALDASTAYIELDTVNSELDAAHGQETLAARLVQIEQQRAEAGVDPLSDLLQAQLTAAQLKLKRLHLETRSGTLGKQLASLTALPVGSITPDHSSIPEIPAVKAGEPVLSTAGIESAGILARSKQLQAVGDGLAGRRPQLGFGAQYNLDSDKLNNYTEYYKNFTPNNFSFGFSIQIPLFDLGLHAKAKESAAEALRAKVEAEQAQRQNDLQIVELTGSLRELDALAEIASLKQQIADEQVKAVEAQLELGNGAGSGPGAPPQLSPKAEELARIDERQKFEDALEAGFDLSKARLNLLHALGHMEDWLHELRAK